VYSKLHCFILFLFAIALSSATVLVAQTAALDAPTPAATAAGILRGHITDQTGAFSTVKADSAGVYEVRGLAPGAYIVKADFAGFAPFESPAITLAAGQSKRVDIAMAVQAEQQNVTVTDESPTVNVEASGNANSVVLKGKDLDALSDDPDELSNELSALAGPSAGPNGGQIFIDGFSGGQLPPKSAIREIRINSNPFSAEYDRLGFGRIEIFTSLPFASLDRMALKARLDEIGDTTRLSP